MSRTMRRLVGATALALVLAATAGVLAQRGGPLTPEQAAARWEGEKQLQEIAIVERKVMVPMRDGVRLATDVYPNQPNVRRYTVELDASLFTGPHFTVKTVGPFVLAIRNSH